VALWRARNANTTAPWVAARTANEGHARGSLDEHAIAVSATKTYLAQRRRGFIRQFLKAAPTEYEVIICLILHMGNYAYVTSRFKASLVKGEETTILSGSSVKLYEHQSNG
jgi:hypothetical protein